MVKEIILTDEEYGKEYLDELKKILDIRKERRLIYGDSFIDSSIEDILSIIHGKFDRADKIKNLHNINHPKYIDEIQDVVNYCIFLLSNVKREGLNNEIKN